MPILDPKTVRHLARALLPNLRFSDLEKYFPVRAESWLTHATSAPWPPSPRNAATAANEVAALRTDAKRRGTALVKAGPTVDAPTHVAGPPNVADEPLRVDVTEDPASIGASAYRGAPDPLEELFLSFAGWADADKRQQGGDLDYLYDAFSELASAIDHRLSWRPLASRPNRPTFAHPQPPAPAVYCEVDWAGVHPRTSRRAGLGDFGPTPIPDLDRYLQFTYYYLFPAREPLADPPQPDVKPQEGQWAAISLFLKVSVDDAALDEAGRPRIANLEDVRYQRPEWVVFSLDPNDTKPTSHVFEFGGEETDVVEMAGYDRHIVSAYVGAGSHRLFPGADAEVNLVGGERWPSLDYEPGSDVEGLLTPVIVGLLPILAVGGLAGLLTGSGTVADVVTAIVLAIGVLAATALVVAIIVLLIVLVVLVWLFLQLAELWDDDADKSDLPTAGDPPISSGSSVGDPSHGDPVDAGPGQAPPGVAAPGATPNGPGGGFAGDRTGWWPTNEGSAKGGDAAFFDVMVISRLTELVNADPTLAPPAWWPYTGRWGIKVPKRADATWDSGSRRTDHHGRSWSYWQAHALIDHWVRTTPPPPRP